MTDLRKNLKTIQAGHTHEWTWTPKAFQSALDWVQTTLEKAFGLRVMRTDTSAEGWVRSEYILNTPKLAQVGAQLGIIELTISEKGDGSLWGLFEVGSWKPHPTAEKVVRKIATDFQKKFKIATSYRT